MTEIDIIFQSAAVLLDFDGVIVDSEKDQLAAWQEAARSQGIHTINSFAVAGRMDEDIAVSLTSSQSDANRLLECKRKIATTMFGDSPPPLVPNIDEFILTYKQKGILAITSNSSKSRLLGICNHYGLTKHFSVIEGARGTCEPKPSPDIYNLVLNKLDIPAADVTAIEDSIPGLVAAKRAGVKTVGLMTSCSRDKLEQTADTVIESFEWVLLKQRLLEKQEHVIKP